MQTDQLLLKRAQKGDPTAFESILATHERLIYSICLRMCGNREDAMDIAQETAVRVWRNIGRYTGDAALSTWIYRIATNACLDHLRKQRDALSIDELGEDGFSPATGEHENPEGVLQGRETMRTVQHALMLLPEEQRAAVILRDIRNLTYEEVAQTLGINLNTAKSRISRGRRALREMLRSDEKLLQTGEA